MKNVWLRFILIFSFAFVVATPGQAQRSTKGFSFIISSDQREHATEEYMSHEYTLGGYEAINKVGKGSFMIVLGDLDPPTATQALIAKVLGKDYLWYPVIGNHDTEVEANTEYLRAMNRGTKTLPYVVRKGPAGCEETTYSFDWNDVHFVILNVYFDGKNDRGSDGNIPPELLTWLENDLKQNTKKRVLVVGHEPLYPFLDMDNGTVRHLADALDKYPENAIRFHRLLVKYHVAAYFSGHTHCAAYANINGLWLINSGHIYGQEDRYTPERLFSSLSAAVKDGSAKGTSAEDCIASFYKTNDREMKKFVFSLGLEKAKTYKDLTEEQTKRRLIEFYADCQNNANDIARYTSLFWQNTEWRKSTFLKVTLDDKGGSVEIYRDKDYTGNYVLRDRVELFRQP